jgi:hypothetical protein
MSLLRLLGLALLLLGVALLMIGMHSSNSMADQMHNTFTGRFTDTTTWYILGGSVSGVLGLVMILAEPPGKSV